jgi:hypothetical protein
VLKGITKLAIKLPMLQLIDFDFFPVYDEYLATPNNYPTLIKMRAFESFSWDELDGGHVSFI